MKPLQVVPDIKPNERTDRTLYEVYGIEDKDNYGLTKVGHVDLFFDNRLSEEEAVEAYNSSETANSSKEIAVALVSLEVDETGEAYLGLHYRTAGSKFDRIRRVTGYLSGDVSSFNDAKRAEEHDRVKHSL